MSRSRKPVSRPKKQGHPTVGLVIHADTEAAPIRQALEACALSIAFEVGADEIANGRPQSNVDVVLVAGRLHSGPDSLFSLVRTRFPDKRVVACARAAEARDVRWAIVKGADGVVWDTQLEQTLELTIRAVLSGLLVIPRELRQQVQPPELTNRQKQALSLVIMGLTNHEIAEKLFLSVSTVKSHLNTAFRKLGVRSRAEAARLITDPEEGLGTGILAITGPGLARKRPPERA